MGKHPSDAKTEAGPSTTPSYEFTLSGENLETSAVEKNDARIDVTFNATHAVQLPPKPTFASSKYSEQAFQRPPGRACPLNIVIQIVASRGDIQPFIALGQELQKYGHRIHIGTHNMFKDFVHESNLEFYPIGGDPADLMAYVVENPGIVPSISSLKAGDIRRKRVMIKDMLEGFWQSCIAPNPDISVSFIVEAIIANPLSFAYAHCA